MELSIVHCEGYGFDVEGSRKIWLEPVKIRLQVELVSYFTIHMLLVLAGSRISASKSMTGSTNRSLENQWQDQAFAAAHQAFEAQDGDVLVRWKCEMVMVCFVLTFEQ